MAAWHLHRLPADGRDADAGRAAFPEGSSGFSGIIPVGLSTWTPIWTWSCVA
jgi:hypothetical protein